MEPTRIEHFDAKASVKLFDEGVLIGLVVDFPEFLHDPCQSQGRDGTAPFDVQPLPVVFIDDIERAKRPAVAERIAHEVQRPDLIERLHGLQGSGVAYQHPFTGSMGQVQFYVAVHAKNALVVPAVALGTQPAPCAPSSLRTPGCCESSVRRRSAASWPEGAYPEFHV